MKGRFITLEGGEGTGKSTQARLLADRLAARGFDVLLTREPGGTVEAEAIRALIIEGAVDRWDAVAETLLHFAARRSHLTRAIRPALRAGRWVVCDRFVDSTTAYQGYGHGIELVLIERLAHFVIEDDWPDLTLVIDLDPATGLRRAKTAGNRYERMGGAFHARVREGFLAIARAHPERCVVVDGDGAVETVAGRIDEAVAGRLFNAAR